MEFDVALDDRGRAVSKMQIKQYLTTPRGWQRNGTYNTQKEVVDEFWGVICFVLLCIPPKM